MVSSAVHPLLTHTEGNSCTQHSSSHSLVDMGAVCLHLLDSRGEFVEQLLIRVQGEQVFFSEQEAEAVAFRPAQAVARWCGHRGDCILDINHRVELT